MSEDAHNPDGSPPSFVAPEERAKYWEERARAAEARTPYQDTKRIVRATGDLDQDTGATIIGESVTKVKLGLAVLATRLLHKIKGTKQ